MIKSELLKAPISSKGKVSGLSLSSIRKKKEHIDAKLAEEVQHEVLPTDDFKEEDLVSFLTGKNHIDIEIFKTEPTIEDTFMELSK